MSSTCSGMPISTPLHLSCVFPVLPLKQFQYGSVITNGPISSFHEHRPLTAVFFYASLLQLQVIVAMLSLALCPQWHIVSQAPKHFRSSDLCKLVAFPVTSLSARPLTTFNLTFENKTQARLVLITWQSELAQMNLFVKYWIWRLRAQVCLHHMGCVDYFHN